MRDWKKWFKAAGVRAIKTVAQTAVATIGTSAVMGDVNWKMVLGGISRRKRSEKPRRRGVLPRWRGFFCFWGTA